MVVVDGTANVVSGGLTSEVDLDGQRTVAEGKLRRHQRSFSCCVTHEGGGAPLRNAGR